MIPAIDLTGGHLDVLVNPGDDEQFSVALPADFTGPSWTWTAENVSLTVAADRLTVKASAATTATVQRYRPVNYVVWLTGAAGRTTMLSGALRADGVATGSTVLVPNPITGVTVPLPVTVGVPGPPGPPGGGGSGASTVLTQASPAGSWSFPNPLNRLVNATIYDTSGAEIDADLTVTPTLIAVAFGQPLAGKVVIS